MKTRTTILTGLAALTLFAGQAGAAIITASGTDTSTFTNWRTTSVTKTLDVDGDNVYGTEGYVLFYTESPTYTGSFKQDFGDPLTRSTTLSSVPSYLTLDSTDVGGSATDWSILSSSYANVDNPTLTPGPTVADRKSGLTGRNESGSGNLLGLTFGSGAPAAGIRLGIVARGSGTDALGNVTLTQVTGGSANASYSGVIGGTDTFTMYFFDITNIASGDQFYVSGADVNGGNNHTLYSGITVDVIPEPSTFALMFGALGAALLIGRRRKR